MSKNFNVTLSGVKISFPVLVEPATEGASKGKYSVQVAFPKDNQNVATMVAAINNAIQEGVEKDPRFKALAARPYAPGMSIGKSLFLQDGDFKFSLKGEPIKSLIGCYFFQPSSNTPVPCYEKVNGKLKKLEDLSAIYGGDDADVIVTVKPGVSKEWGIYIGIYLQAVLAHFTGENLSAKGLSDTEVASGFGMEVATDEDTKAIEGEFAPQDGFKGWA
jgi:hypothetical protein